MYQISSELPEFFRRYYKNWSLSPNTVYNILKPWALDSAELCQGISGPDMDRCDFQN